MYRAYYLDMRQDNPLHGSDQDWAERRSLHRSELVPRPWSNASATFPAFIRGDFGPTLMT